MVCKFRSMLVFVQHSLEIQIDWLIDWPLYGKSAQKGYKWQETLLNKIWSSFVDKYNCVWRNADWPASWHINTKSYQWQWKCGCSLTSCFGHHSVWMQFNAWLTQVSRHIELLHQHCCILSHCRWPRTRSSVDRRYTRSLCVLRLLPDSHKCPGTSDLHTNPATVKIRPLVDRRRITGTVSVPAGIYEQYNEMVPHRNQQKKS